MFIFGANEKWSLKLKFLINFLPNDIYLKKNKWITNKEWIIHYISIYKNTEFILLSDIQILFPESMLDIVYTMFFNSFSYN